MMTSRERKHAWVVKIYGGKGNFEVIFADGSIRRVRLKKNLNVHWKRDPRRLSIGRVVLVEDSQVPPGLVVEILTPADAARYGQPPTPPEQDLVFV